MKVDFEQMVTNLMRKDYKYINSGSGRLVFDLGNGYVVKVAKNQKGLAQNETEYRIASKDDTHLFARILDVSEDFKYLIMEKAEKIKSISYVWHYFNVKSNRRLYQIEELRDIASRNNLVLLDFGRSANWGKVNDKPVIIDYGFTKEVRKKYY